MYMFATIAEHITHMLLETTQSKNKCVSARTRETELHREQEGEERLPTTTATTTTFFLSEKLLAMMVIGSTVEREIKTN